MPLQMKAQLLPTMFSNSEWRAYTKLQGRWLVQAAGCVTSMLVHTAFTGCGLKTDNWKKHLAPGKSSRWHRTRSVRPSQYPCAALMIYQNAVERWKEAESNTSGEVCSELWLRSGVSALRNRKLQMFTVVLRHLGHQLEPAGRNDVDVSRLNQYLRKQVSELSKDHLALKCS